MRKRQLLPGGDLEQAVLAAIWASGSASSRDIYERVGRPLGLVYTTIAKVLDRLFAKKLVARSRIGKSFVYEPAAEEHAVQQARLTQLLTSVFGEKPEQALAPLVDAVESIDPDLLDELLRVVRQRQRSRDGS